MRITIIVFLVAVLGCSESTPPGPPFTVSFDSFLQVPVTIAANGVHQTIPATGEASIVLPGGTTEVSVLGENFKYTNGEDEVDDLSVSFVLVAPDATIQITSTFGAVEYVAPHIDNQTGAAIAVGVFDGSTVKCIGGQGSGSVVQYGYYRLTAATEVRTYQTGTGCTGHYLLWSSSAVKSSIFLPKTGVALLTATTAP